MLTAQIEELHRVRGLSSGLDWVLMCPDPNARQALLALVAEEITATIDGVVYVMEARAGSAGEVGGEKSQQI